MPDYVFYSWQTDSPRRHNSNFIEEALKMALEGTDRILDFATRERGGAVDIPAAIFQKISDSAFAVFDVTPVTRTEQGRAMPNPNVLIELGFAGRAIGWERTILICNTIYFTVEELPCDFRPRRCLRYDSSKQKPPVLANNIKYAIAESENENLANLNEARARLTAECMQLLLGIPEPQGFFSMATSPELLRLLDLRLIRADYNLLPGLFAYQFTPLGRDLRRAAFLESDVPVPSPAPPGPAPIAS